MNNKALVFDLSTEGLYPLKHRIIGITLKTEAEEKVITHPDEKVVLQKFWEYTATFQKIVGFNSAEFDVPMLIIRSIKHKVKIPDLNGKLVDLRRVIIGRNGKGTLQDFQELLEIKFFDSRYKKMHMSLLWERDFPKLKDFLLRDVKVTWDLYKHIEEAGLV